MDYSLIDHTRGYQFSYSDAFISLATGLSGVPYARRHYQLSNIDSDHCLGHRLICFLECWPLLGGIIALIERVFDAIFGKLYSDIPWRTKTLTIEDADQKMALNAIRAVNEHHDKSSVFASDYGSFESSPQPLSFTHTFADDIGPRPTMEDAHFYAEIDKGVLTGVFDGHGGKDVSDFASKEFQKRFPNMLLQTNGNVHQAFETVIHQIHQDIVRNSSWNCMGTTAVVCFIDKATNWVYTATLGDSEANIYRKTGWFEWKSIPLSCVRDWMSKKDQARLEKVHGKNQVLDRLKDVHFNPKKLRSHLNEGVNVSRGMGDVDETGTPDYSLAIHKPKITVNQLHSGDILVLACDGLKDYVPEHQIVRVIRSQNSFTASRTQETLAQKLVNCAKEMKAQDNVTVIAIEVK